LTPNASNCDAPHVETGRVHTRGHVIGGRATAKSATTQTDSMINGASHYRKRGIAEI
jgi:hypothetical protein